MCGPECFFLGGTATAMLPRKDMQAYRSSEPNRRCAGRACDGQPTRALVTNCHEHLGGSPAAKTDGPAERWNEEQELHNLRLSERPNV